MSTDSTGTEVFEDVDPDPDAVLAEFGMDSPDDLADADGAHDTIPDEEIDVDDTTAAELFADLEDIAAADRTENDDDADDGDDVADLEFEFVGDSDVTVRDGDVIDSTAAELTELTATEFAPGERHDSGDGAETTTSCLDDGTESAATGDGSELATTNDLGDGSDSADSSRTLTVDAGAADGLELVGPDPTPTRVTNDTFSRADAGAR